MFSLWSCLRFSCILYYSHIRAIGFWYPSIGWYTTSLCICFSRFTIHPPPIMKPKWRDYSWIAVTYSHGTACKWTPCPALSAYHTRKYCLLCSCIAWYPMQLCSLVKVPACAGVGLATVSHPSMVPPWTVQRIACTASRIRVQAQLTTMRVRARPGIHSGTVIISSGNTHNQARF